MVNILIVDDDLARVRQIAAHIDSVGLNTTCCNATTKKEAVIKMINQQFELVIIDIILPEKMTSTDFSDNAGIELLDLINMDLEIKRPLSVIGVTSNEETYNSVKDEFDKSMIPLIIWGNDNTRWKEQIERKIAYLDKLSTDYIKINKNKIDVAIITAVPDEYDALDNLPIKWNDCSFYDDPGLYSIGTCKDNNGEELTVLKTLLPEMGMTAATNTTTKIIRQYDPESVVMVGICGGESSKVKLGDVVVAEITWDYGNGKIRHRQDGDEYYNFSPQPNQIRISPSLKTKIQRKSSLISEICKTWNQNHSDDKTARLIIGALPSGASVIEDTLMMEKVILPQYRKVLGLDMETYGVYFSCSNTTNKQINFVSIKSVSDLADQDKDDTYHEFCSYMSSQFAFTLIKHRII